MNTTRRQEWLWVLVVFGCAALWSTSGVLIKVLNRHGQGMPAVSIACSRSLLSGLMLLPFAWGQRRTLRNAPTIWLVASGVAFAVMAGSFVAAATRTAAANAIILQYTAPIWVFVLSPLLLGEATRWGDGVALLLAMAGVAVIFCGGATGDPGALFFALTSGLGYGLVIIITRRLREVNPAVVTCLNVAGSGLLLLPAMIRWGTFAITAEQAGWLVVLSLFQFAIPYVLLSMALRHVNAQHVALITLVETLLNPLWTYLFLGERVPAATWLGGPLILAGAVGWMWLSWKRGQAP